MDLEAHRVIYGEEFHFCATTTSNPNLHTPTGVNVSHDYYDQQNFLGRNDQCQHYTVEATPSRRCIVPDYVSSLYGPNALHPHGGQFLRAQDYLLDTVDHIYSQQGHTPHYVVLPSMADRTPAIPRQTITYNRDFPPSHVGCDTSEYVVLPSMVDRTPAIPSQTVADISDFPPPHVRCKMMTGDRSQPCSKPSSHANHGMSFVSQKKEGKAKKPFMSSEIIVKSYTSRLDIGNAEGNITIRTDKFNRDDFQVVYRNAKFFVIKPINLGDVHKSIKYGVWSTSSIGNEKLDSAFREAQLIAASSCTSCPVLLFFSVNGSSHFCGVAEMVGPVNIQKDMDFWSKDRWIGSFPVMWHIIKDICNSTLRSMMLQNNEYKPVTINDPQEIDYIRGTSMLQIFKYTRAEKCLLDKFIMHDEEEARNLERRRFKVRRGAQHFVRAHPILQPKSDRVLMYRAIREANNLKDELQDLNLDDHQGSCHDFGKLNSKASTTEHIERKKVPWKAGSTYQAQQAQTSNMKPDSDGEQNCKKVEITLSGKIHSEIACVSAKTSEDYASKDKLALAAPDMTHEVQKISCGQDDLFAVFMD